MSSKSTYVYQNLCRLKTIVDGNLNIKMNTEIKECIGQDSSIMNGIERSEEEYNSYEFKLI